MQKTSTGKVIPQRASLLQSSHAAPLTQSYTGENDTPLNTSILGNVLYKPTTRATMATTTRTLAPDMGASTQRAVGTSTRTLLWIVLVLCVAFLLDALIVPAATTAVNHVRYGADMISAYDVQGKHFVTQDTHNRISILISDSDGTHPQLLTTIVSGNTDRALITLSDSGGGIVDVRLNGTRLASLKRDSKGGYTWIYPS